MVQQRVKKKMAENKYVQVAFIDLKKVCNAVPKTKMWNGMQKIVKYPKIWSGFTAGKSWIDNMYIMQQWLEKKMAKNKDVQVAFID